MSYDAGAHAKDILALITQYLDIEGALQFAYDQGVADATPGSADLQEDFFA